MLNFKIAVNQQNCINCILQKNLLPNIARHLITMLNISEQSAK